MRTPGENWSCLVLELLLAPCGLDAAPSCGCLSVSLGLLEGCWPHKERRGGAHSAPCALTECFCFSL